MAMTKKVKYEMFLSIRQSGLSTQGLKPSLKQIEEYKEYFMNSYSRHEFNGVALSQKLKYTDIMPFITKNNNQTYKQKHLSKDIEESLNKIISHIDFNLGTNYIETIKRDSKTHYIFIRPIHKKFSTKLGPMIDTVIRKINKYARLFPDCVNTYSFIKARDAISHQGLMKKVSKALQSEVHATREDFWSQVEENNFKYLAE